MEEVSHSILYMIDDIDGIIMNNDRIFVDIIFMNDNNVIYPFLKRDGKNVSIDNIYFMKEINDSGNVYKVVDKSRVEAYIILHKNKHYIIYTDKFVIIGRHDSDSDGHGDEYREKPSIFMKDIIIINPSGVMFSYEEKYVIDFDINSMSIRECGSTDEFMYNKILEGFKNGQNNQV